MRLPKRRYEIASTLTAEISIKLERDKKVATEYLLTGSDAVALGAIAGNWHYDIWISHVPATGVLSFLSQHAGNIGIVAEQTEDEISP